jgi:hypothetical protein
MNDKDTVHAGLLFIVTLLLSTVLLFTNCSAVSPADTDALSRLALSKEDLQGTGLEAETVFAREEKGRFGLILQSTDGLRKALESSAKVEAGCSFSLPNPEVAQYYKLDKKEDTVEAMGIKGEIYLYQSREQAEACYRELEGRVTSDRGSWNNYGATVETLADTFGDRSSGIFYVLPSSYYITAPRFIAGNVRDVDVCFQAGNAVARCKVSWLENIPQVIDKVERDAMFERGGDRFSRHVDATLTFSDAEYKKIQARKKAALALIRNWASRVGKEAGQPRPIIFELKSDKNQYFSGEPVLLSGAVKKYVKKSDGTGSYELYGKEAPLSLVYAMPGEGEKPLVMTHRNVNALKDPQGRCTGAFSFYPFAPHRTGAYTITGQLTAQHYPEMKDYPSDRYIQVSVKFTAVAPPSPNNEQFEKIEKKYRETVPSHRKEIEKRYQSDLRLCYARSKVGAPREGLGTPSDLSYGSYNNSYFGSNGFHCVGYQVKTLYFLDHLRFSPIKEERELLRGIDYGPILRGYRSFSALGGEHHAIALYRYGEDWNQAGAKVLDPWPSQSPRVVTVNEFNSCIGKISGACGDLTWREKYDNPLFLPYPTIGGAVYWNMSWDGLRGTGIDYIEGAGCSLNKADSIQGVFKDAPAHRFGEKPEQDSAVTPPGVSVVADCPVMLEASARNGERIAFSGNGEIIADIKGSQFYLHSGGKDDLHWYLWLPEGSYSLRVIGTAPGKALITTGSGDGVTCQYLAPVEKGKVSTLELSPGKLKSSLVLADGRALAPVIAGRGRNGGAVYVLILVIPAILLASIAVVFIIYRRTAGKGLARGNGASASLEQETGDPPTAPQQAVLPLQESGPALGSTPVCPACHNAVKAESLFCSRCGEPLTSSASRFCRYCGNALKMNSRFCSHCGSKL